ncbi:dihydroorotase-like cyclic amidohydrolase [Clostridium beijerinckii]|nr:dihydroorotase-like cyclic amidohydrolase [Clostridium beijerinckii]
MLKHAHNIWNLRCDVYKREDGRNFVCSPPMKGQESQDALWESY